MGVALQNGVRIGAYLPAVGIASLSVLASGCAADPAVTLRALGSWAATSAMLGRAWADGATPRAYTERALDRLKRELVAQERELGRLPARERAAATPITGRASKSTRDMTDAVRTGDRKAARALAETLAVDARRLQQLAGRDARSS
jgi:hypothetical protein